MTPELLIPILAAAPLLFFAWHGWKFGASLELRHFIAHGFSLLVATAFWQPVYQILAGSFPDRLQIPLIAAFLVLYVIAFAVAAFAVSLRAPAWRSVQANPVDQFLGAGVGLLTGSFVAGAILLILLPAMPPGISTPETARTGAEWPKTVLRAAESGVAKLTGSPHPPAPFPTVQFLEEPIGSGPDENGMMQYRRVPEVVWK